MKQYFNRQPNSFSSNYQAVGELSFLKNLVKFVYYLRKFILDMNLIILLLELEIVF